MKLDDRCHHPFPLPGLDLGRIYQVKYCVLCTATPNLVPCSPCLSVEIPHHGSTATAPLPDRADRSDPKQGSAITTSEAKTHSVGPRYDNPG